MNAYLELIIGPMYSGKTSYLINKYKQFTFCNNNILVLNHQIDTRYSNSQLSNHDLNMIPCQMIDKLSIIFEKNEINDLYEKAEVILINEGQFFKELEFSILKMLDDNKKIYIAGLDSDFQKKKFGKIIDLIPYCDKITKLASLCSICKNGTKAIFSHRISSEKEQTLVGSTNYIPLCRNCYKINN